MKKAAYLTPGEFELMQILWTMPEASVRQVWEKVRPQRAVAYTTIMTVLHKMYRKGVLSQRKKGKAYLYAAAIARQKALEDVVEGVIDTYFKGSHEELLRFIHSESPSGKSSAPSHSAEDKRDASLDEFLL